MGLTVHFAGRAGRPDVAVAAEAGERLLDVAWRAGQPLEGTCGGQMACSTCHVVLEASALALLPPPVGEEEDLLDLAPASTRGSRLACQVRLPDGLAEMVVRLPGR